MAKGDGEAMYFTGIHNEDLETQKCQSSQLKYNLICIWSNAYSPIDRAQLKRRSAIDRM